MDRRDTKTATLLIMALFGLQPMAFGAWLALIPYIKTSLDLNKADLSLALLGMPLALIPMLQLASRVVARIGPRRTFAVMLPIQTAAVLLPFAAGGVGTLFLALACFGAVIAFLEVALNTYAGRLEKAAGAYIMSRCHGFWALGVGVGSFLVTVLFPLGPVVAVLVICVLSAALGIWAGLSLPRLTGEAEGPGPARQTLREMPKALFVIAIFVLFITMAEGAMSDWAAVYLAERWGGSPEDAGIAVTVFAGFLDAGRFAGDWLKARLGPGGVARFTVGLALTGLVLMTVPTPLPFFFIGVALVGLGVSVGFPLGISAAAALDDTHEAQNIATMAMIAMTAFLIAPPLIGFAADAVTLRFAIMLLIPGLIVSFVLSRIFDPRD